MQVIDMKVRVPRKVAANNLEDFMMYYQERAGNDKPSQKEMKWF